MRNLTDLLLFFVMAIWLAACQHGTIIGEDLIDEDNTQVQEIDSLSVESASLLLDSMYTTDGTRLLVGSYPDPYLGNISAQCFFNADTFDIFSLDDDDNFRFDSLSLSLRQDYEYPATDHLQRLTVYTLESTLDDETFYFNDSPAPGTLNKIATASFNTRTTRSKRFNIRLPDVLGQTLLKVAKGQDDLLLENVLKGLALVHEGDNEGQSVMGFPSDSVQIRLYYHDQKTDAAGEVKLRLKPGRRFNRITSDRGNTVISKLTQQGVPLSSSQSGHQTFIQAGVGICTKLDFPTLRSIRQNRNISVNLAYLDIQPLKTSYQGSDFSPLENIYVYSPTHKNTLAETYWSSRDYNPVSVRRTIDPLTGNSNFRIYLTDYVHDILHQDGDDYDGIMLYAPVFSTGLNELGRLVLPSQRLSRDAIKLHVIFTVIK
ncbi:DUF4270 family protein [Haliscomenobacter sp.]|uniref:DUF4270 family protein n=1 Tax=Haliscomenobacter sp. TaxID=2717303 RepID=UPI003BAB2EB0